LTEVEKMMAATIGSLGVSLGFVGRWLIQQVNYGQMQARKHEERIIEIMNGDRAEAKIIMRQVADSTHQIAEALKDVRRCPYDEEIRR